MDDVVQIGDDKFIDSSGNKFDGDAIRLNEHLGGGFERVSGSMFDNPRGSRKKKTNQKL